MIGIYIVGSRTTVTLRVRAGEDILRSRTLYLGQSLMIGYLICSVISKGAVQRSRISFFPNQGSLGLWIGLL